MQILLVILLPPVALLAIGKPWQAIFNLLLLVTVLGWIPAAVWAIFAVNGAHADKRNRALIDALEQRR
jgi:uncharacterized membrane protein YqaE (UPF0057 family)